MLVIINCILALIFFFVFFIMLHSEPSFIKLAIVLTAHDSLADCKATLYCYKKIQEQKMK